MQRNQQRLTLLPLACLGLLLAAWLLPSVLRAQELEGAPQSWGPYTVTSSWEFGVRFLGRDGSQNKYRSDVNMGRGARLFNFNFLARAEDGKAAKLFDTMRLNGFGFGGDPNAVLNLRIEKNRWYQFDYTYRRTDYFNFLNNIALGQHDWDTGRRWQDFGLTFFPQSKFRVLLGYSRNSAFGNSLSTYDYSRDEFLVLQPVRRQHNDYRVGFEWRFVQGAVLNFEQGWRTYREDTRQLIPAPSGGNNLTNTTVLNSFRRDNPTRNFSPYTLLGLHARFWKKFDFSGRYLYSGSTTDYVQAQVLTGRDFSNNIVNLDTTSVLARARRPNGAFDWSLTWMAHDKLWFSNSFSLTNFRILGDSALDETILRSRTTPFGTTTLPPLVIEDFEARFLGVRYVQNLFDVNLRPVKQLAFRVGYRYMQRRTAIAEQTNPREVETTSVNTVLVGFRFQPHRIFTLYGDYEHGNTINPFTRVSNYRVNNYRLRSQFKPHKSLLIGGSVLLRDNHNPTPFVSNEFRNRSYAFNIAWTPKEQFTLDIGYDKIHYGTDAGLLFFVANVQRNGRILYISNSNLFYYSARIAPSKRVEIYAAYRIVNDTGTDRISTDPNQFIAQYPLKFQSPEFRLALKFRNGVEWIAGYQYYRYAEDLATTQNYRAHLPYTSLRLYF